MTTFFYKKMTRNSQIGNTPVWVLPDIYRLGIVWDTKFGTNVSNKMLLNVAKEKTNSEGKITPHRRTPATQIRVSA